MRNLNFLQLTAIYLTFSVLPSAMALRNAVEAARAVGLLPRADVCGGMADYTQCGSGFPSAFCCPSSSTCFGVSGNASVVCCPKGNANCELINPLSCDIQFYNATAHPESPMHASNLNVQLATCGTNTCCPPGYICNTNGLCTLNTPTATASKASSTATATAARLTTATSAAAHAPTSAATDASSVTPSGPSVAAAECEAFPTNAILVGFFSGLVAGSLITFLFVICLGRRSRKKAGNTPLKVSEPIYHETSADRTDFLRHAPKSGHSSGTNIDSTAPSTPLSRVRSLFSGRTPNLSPKNWGSRENHFEPSTPPGQLKREPSQEITIFSPPDARMSRSTTFRDVMKAAGIHERDTHTQFMGSPGLVDPRSRGVDAGRLR